MARRYNARVVWQQDGTKYQRDAEITVTASGVRAAMSKSVAKVRKTAKGWLEPFGANFSIHLIVGPRVEKGGAA